mmetsp:Transcript_21520/g.36214  ORF Transcript_21520/g.36214 Transcript_21520/m.36214 type:complete len:174 (+) Transcript_21520:148-669(+)|eukprot:CAMPEP_0114427062 /NCGR_PEP_ID=MMETSP0103-20121206/8141_1 /TAXON_ID=37642 ORGANISM="Paraphysomonas imperforata, Strain PA2" /NCGR_SAMPLE_ID=MMETSP0103 /ASSEMBLY_ACC=CAM_ASM_000201 /LENGTH=173 /DNA_ID=CAMNT_0001596085 /DNA_START=128 /DNA_END=649 /DNA_ORIENTATION=+
MSSTTPHDETILKISNALDEYIYAGLYKRSANQLEFSLSGLAHMTKVTKKLIPIKVYAFVMGVLCTIALLKVFSSSPVKGIIYLVLAYDSFQVSYNSYERSYASIAARRTLSSTKEIGSVIMSFFTCGKKAKDSEQDDVLKALAEEVKWKFLIDGTFTEMAYKKAKKSNLIES